MIDQGQRRLPEWLPYPDPPLEEETAELIATYYADQICELCAGIQLTLQQQHKDVRVYHYSAKDFRETWVPEGRDFTLAHVAVAK